MKFYPKPIQTEKPWRCHWLMFALFSQFFIIISWRKKTTEGWICCLHHDSLFIDLASDARSGACIWGPSCFERVQAVHFSRLRRQLWIKNLIAAWLWKGKISDTGKTVRVKLPSVKSKPVRQPVHLFASDFHRQTFLVLACRSHPTPILKTNRSASSSPSPTTRSTG